MHKLLLLIFLSLFAFANDLILQKGEIIAHTEVFGDSEINPKTKSINSILSINKTIESIKGEINIASISLKSEKEDRDKNMYELLNIELHPNISLKITNIQKIDINYEIKGDLTLNGVTKTITSLANIEELKNTLTMKGDFSINLTQFSMDPPTMFFLTVRDQIDIKYDLSYTKGE